MIQILVGCIKTAFKSHATCIVWHGSFDFKINIVTNKKQLLDNLKAV